MEDKYLIVIPTYNECDNIPYLIEQLHDMDDNLHLLFIDDSSPDGTGSLIDFYISKNKRIHVIHREGKLGVGSAHKVGLKWARDHSWRNVITMDADMSHSPADVKKLITLDNKKTIVVCSRWLTSNSLPNWSLYRKAMTKIGHFLTTNLLKIPHDATNAFRYYRMPDIPENLFSQIESNGYSFFYESLFIFNKNKLEIGQMAIALPARTYGDSKMNFQDVWNSFTFLWVLYFRNFFGIKNKLKNKSISIADQAEVQWDQYWSSKGHEGKGLYDFIASIYRTFLIKPAVNYFLIKHFPPKSRLLHAGCGSGMVDIGVEDKFLLTGLDISQNALLIYKNNHSPASRTIHGSIFNVPVDDGLYDGIFNLGVMEHFTEDEIVQILRSFEAALKPKGRIILFWPPSYGIATMFLKFIHTIFHTLGLNIKLHPDEITYADKSKQVNLYLAQAGFNLISFYFGYRDMFTHRIVVAEKNN